MKQTVFLYNYMMDKQWLRSSKLPIEFIQFGYIEDVKLYHINKNYYGIKDFKKLWGMNRIYGGIFQLDHSEFYMQILDAFNGSSKSALKNNNPFDLMHRTQVEVRPIYFDRICELYNMHFRESDTTIRCETYLINQKNDIMNFKLNNSTRNREFMGFDTKYFIKKIIEEKGE